MRTTAWSVFGLRYGYVAPWDYDFGKGGFIGATLSRRIASVGDVIDIESEIGLGQRFGNAHQQELWAALYLRWTWFLWNDYLRTTIAVSTGLNYATGISAEERLGSGTDRGSWVLHYLAPEITFGLPQYPDWEALIRLHHRSGGRSVFGPIGLFKGVDGGTQYLSFGLRYRF